MIENLKEVPDFVIFVGRFHPLLVHLPIGMLLVAITMHFLARKESFLYLKKSIPFILAVGTISAIVTCVLGYLLSYQGGYNEEALSDHQWLGIGVTVISILAYFVSVWEKTKQNNLLNSIVMVVISVGLGFTGHLGGNLTHGSTYLTQYAPNPIRAAIGLPPKAVARPVVKVIDSADVYLDVIQPLLASKCISCHNPDKLKGNLLLTSHAEMLKGGVNGPSVVAGNLKESELFKRITLPEHHKEFMPPEGKQPFSELEVDLIKFWIVNGAKSQGLLADVDLKKEQTKQFKSFFGIDGASNGVLGNNVATVDSITLKSLRSYGFKIQKISNKSNLLEVAIPYGNKKARSHIKELLAVKKQVVFLNLSNLNIQDEDLKIIGQLKLLTGLNLNSNPNISSTGVRYLTQLQHLEYLNLYGTVVNDDVLKSIRLFKKLKRIYLWNTKVTQEKIKEIKTQLPDLKVS